MVYDPLGEGGGAAGPRERPQRCGIHGMGRWDEGRNTVWQNIH